MIVTHLLLFHHFSHSMCFCVIINIIVTIWVFFCCSCSWACCQLLQLFKRRILFEQLIHTQLIYMIPYYVIFIISFCWFWLMFFFYSLFTGDGHHRHIRIKCIEFECLLRSMNVHVRNILYAVFVSFHSIFHNPNW